MWVAVPVLVVVVVAGLWWAIFSEADPGKVVEDTSVPRIVPTQPTQAPTEGAALPEETPTATPILLPPPATFTPTPSVVTTPTGPAEVAEEEPSGDLAIGDAVVVANTGGVGLNIRTGPGTSFARIKTLPEGAVTEVVGGPREADNYTWYQIRDETGTIGWGASRFMQEQ
jgi:hypothetical protein